VADEVALAADACIGWHDSWSQALRVRTEMDGDAWRALDRPPVIYFTAITRRPEAPAEALANAQGVVCDAWSRLDLGPFGFEPFASEPWFFRPAGPLPPAEEPAKLEIVRVTAPEEVQELEAVSARGFEGENATVQVGSIHPVSILDDRRMTNWIGRVDGRSVAAAMSYRTDRAIGVFGVTTIASARGRGYGTAMTRAAVLAESALPSVLAPSREAERLYGRLGFRSVGELCKWRRVR